jgi:hypothetical protein
MISRIQFKTGRSLLFLASILTFSTLAFQCPASDASHVIYNVDFGDGSVSPKKGLAAYGNNCNDYWNLCAGNTQISLFDYYGVSNNVILTHQYIQGYGYGVWGVGADDPMYDSFLWSWEGNQVVSVGNLPDGTYDFVVYGHANNGAEDNGVFQLTCAGTNYGTLSTTSTNLNYTSSDWQEGLQYIVFRNVTVQNGQSPVLTCFPNSSFVQQSVIAGLQILSYQEDVHTIFNVAFGSDTTNKIGAAAYGISGDYWNQCSPWILQRYLLTGAGSFSGAVLTHAYGNSTPGSFGYWANGAEDPMYGYFIWNWDAPQTITVSNLSAGQYDVAVYGHGNNDAIDNGIYTLTCGGINYGTLATTSTNPNYTSPVWQEGLQYVVFRDVVVQSGNSLVLTCSINSGAYQQSLISGIQVITVAP